jgi:hypothetical protein
MKKDLPASQEMDRSKSGKRRKLQQGVETPNHPTLSPPKTRPSTAAEFVESPTNSTDMDRFSTDDPAMVWLTLAVLH